MPPSDRQSRKRLATRQAISDAATRLFVERGFDKVTIDEIAEAADVGRMTVFNHFPRKEDMFFDRNDEVCEILLETLRGREPDVSPIESLRLLAHRLVSEESPYLGFSPRNESFIATISGSETLKARARAMRDELSQVLAGALSECAGREPDDSDARLTSELLIATWTAAYIQGHLAFRLQRNSQQAQVTFLSLIDKGTIGIKAAMTDTPYA